MNKPFLTILASIVAILTSVAHATNAPQHAVQVNLLNTSPAVKSMSLSDIPVKSLFLKEDEEHLRLYGFHKHARGWYRNIYPGVDLACYGDEYQFEYIFILQPSADLDRIKLKIESTGNIAMGHDGNIILSFDNGEIIQKTPVVFLQEKKTRREIDGRYIIDRQNYINLSISEMLKKKEKLNDTPIVIIPGGDQPGGPPYDFYYSKFEATTEQFLRFLNDAQANSKSPKGANMFFDKVGNVWFDPRMKNLSHKLFDAASSRLIYRPNKPEGSRYDHQRDKKGNTLFAKHPITGVSWYGAIKYCNWLTIQSGRGLAECCYTEGPKPEDWAPVSATNWSAGLFGEAERALWLSLKGFRLPMINTVATLTTTNTFNEWLKVSSWHANTNKTFGYGRNTFEGIDANTLSTIARPINDTMPIGYFEGNNFLGMQLLTRGNDNYYGVFDLTGNAAEWVNDHGRKGLVDSRGLCGGSFANEPRPVCQGQIVQPHIASHITGFRPLTTYMPDQKMFIHILYSFFMEPKDKITEEISEEEAALDLDEKEDTGALPTTPEDYYRTAEEGTEPETTGGIGGIVYKETPEEEKETGEEEEKEEGGGFPPYYVPPTPPPTPIRILTVSSLNPDSGVYINIEPQDLTRSDDGFTAFTRIYQSGSSILLSAPNTALGNNVFVRWLRNSIIYSFNNTVNLTLNTDTTMTAVYMQ